MSSIAPTSAARDVRAGPWRVRRVEGAPLVAVRVALAGGSRREPAPGLAVVAGRALAEGTRRRDYLALAAEAEARGMSLVGSAGLESTALAVDGLASDWERALELAAEAVLESTFPEARVGWLARQAAAELEAQADEADLLTARAFAELVFAPHPKGRPLLGDVDSLTRLRAADCEALHAEALERGGVVAVAGAIDEEAVAARLEALFSGLRAPADDDFTPPAPAPRATRRREIETRARDQAHLFVGQWTVGRAHADCAALELAAVALGAGSGLSGRIPHRIRDQDGLAYHASADAVGGAGLDAGRFAAYVGTAPETVGRAERAVVEEVRKLLAEGLSQREIDDARSYLSGREPFRRETARQWADLAALGAIERLPLEVPDWSRARIERPSRDDVNAALRRWLDPDALSVAVGLPSA